MIDYIPPDIPPAIVEYVHKTHQNLPEDVTGHWFKYLTVWNGNVEVYATNWNFKPLEQDSKTGRKEYRQIGLPTVLIYDCHDVRRATINEGYDIHLFMPRYLVTSKIKPEHLCHRDLEAFNQHNTPNPYNTKPKYHTPHYIPKAVKKYIDAKFPFSWYPNANSRYVKYLATYDNKYEVYFVYWINPRDKDYRSFGKYILYDCKNAREYQNFGERSDLMSLRSDKYDFTEKPSFCSSKLKHKFNFFFF